MPMDFLTGSKQEFDTFIKSIKKEDKIAVLTHTDLDGIASAVFLSEILKINNLKIKIIKFLQYKSGLIKSILSELLSNDITKLFILDFNCDADENGIEDFEELRKNIPTFLIDHHPSSPNLKDKRNILKTKSEDCTALTVYNLGKEYFRKEKYIELVCSAMITDFSFTNKNNLEFIKEYYPDFNENYLKSSIGKKADLLSLALIYFRSKLIHPYKLILNNKIEDLEKYSKFVKKEVDKILDDFEKNKESYPNKNIYIYYFENSFGILSYISTELSIKYPNKTIIIISPREKGFLGISGRNQTGDVDISNLIKKGISGLNNATAGGHKKASGGSIQKQDLDKFKENILG